MTTYTPIRQALGDAFLGDTSLTKDLFPGQPQTFDQRLLDLLNGLGQLDPALLDGAISGGDVAGFLREISATSQAERLAWIQAVKASLLPPAATLSGSLARVWSGLHNEPILSVPFPGETGAAYLRCSKVSADAFILSGSGAIQPFFCPSTNLTFLDGYEILFPASDQSLCTYELLTRIGLGNAYRCDFQVHYGYTQPDVVDPNDPFRAHAPAGFVMNALGNLAIIARGRFFPWIPIGDSSGTRQIPNVFEFSASIVLPPVS